MIREAPLGEKEAIPQTEDGGRMRRQTLACYERPIRQPPPADALRQHKPRLRAAGAIP